MTDLATRVLARSFRIDKESIQKLRKEFLALAKNISRVKDERDLNKLRGAFKVFRNRFNRVFFEEWLNRQFKYDDSIRGKSWHEKELREKGWTFYIELSFPGRFWEERKKWDARLKAKARPLWKALQSFIDEQEGSSYDIQTTQVDDTVLEGFKVRVIGEPEDWDAFSRFKESLRVFRKNVSKVFPAMLRVMLPMHIITETKLGDSGRYHGRFIEIYIGGGHSSDKNPNRWAQVIAHEMGHHLWKNMLGKTDRAFWDTAIRGNYAPLTPKEIEYALKVWPDGAWLYEMPEKLKDTEPTLALQLQLVGWGHGGRRELNKKEDFEAALARGESIVVPKNPISGYAGKNSEEAFCEALGMLVGYGPRTVDPLIKSWLRMILPGVKVASKVAKSSGVDSAIKRKALEVYKSLPYPLQSQVDEFLRGVLVGVAPRLESMTDELYEAYEPVRDLVRKRHGSKVTLYRGEPKNKPKLRRKWLSWTPSWKLATYFGVGDGEDHEIVEAQVRASDIVAVFVSPNNSAYIEYVVRDRPEYHTQQSEEQVPFMGYVTQDAKGRDLGFPNKTVLNGQLGYWDFDPNHAKQEFPKIQRAVESLGGKVLRKSINEEDEGASMTVLLPSTVETRKVHGDLVANAGPYYVEDLRPYVGRSLRARVIERYLSERVAARFKEKKEVPSQDGGKTTVYVYSERQIALRNKKKADRLEKLGKGIKKLRGQVKRDLKSSDPETRLTALAVALMDHTYERVGNSSSAAEGHFGVTGWQRKHMSFGSGGTTISYVGKSGVKQKKTITDAAIKKALKESYDSLNGDDTCVLSWDGGCVTAEKVNSYLKPFEVTAKDIRGYHANEEMRKALKGLRKGTLPSDKKEREKKLKEEFKEALEVTAKAVGHEASTLKNQYLIPGLEDSYLKDGSIQGK